MFQSCSAIVLSRMKYSDTGMIVRVFTDKFGMISLLIKGVRGKKSKASMFQPFTILDVVVNLNNKKDLHYPKEYSLKYNPVSMHTDIYKTSVTLFLSELIYKTLEEKDENPLLYGFLEKSIMFLDETEESISNFHLLFMLKYSSFLGFGIENESGNGSYFDLEKGVFADEPVHSNFLTKELSAVLTLLLKSNYSTMQEVKITNAVRNELLDSIIQFYYIHNEGMRRLKSKDVLDSVFSV